MKLHYLLKINDMFHYIMAWSDVLDFDTRDMLYISMKVFKNNILWEIPIVCAYILYLELLLYIKNKRHVPLYNDFIRRTRH